jgi:TPR repeat protein
LIYVLVIYLGTLVDPQYRHLLAKRGNAAMQFDLGWMHEIGYRVPRNPKEAIKWYQLAANKKHAGAQFALGVMYYDGKYVKQNRREALKLFQRSAENGIFESQLNLGLMYYQRAKGLGLQKDKKKAFKLFRDALTEEEYLKNGNRYSIFSNHWNHHHKGILLRDDMVLAALIGAQSDFTLARRAAKASLAQRAENALGQMYEQGQGVKQDYKEAIKWYQRAVKKNFGWNNCSRHYDDTFGCDTYSYYPEAQYNLGRMYANGYGVSKDNVLAYMWWNIASTVREVYGRYQYCIGDGKSKVCDPENFKWETMDVVIDAKKSKKLLEKDMTTLQIFIAKIMSHRWQWNPKNEFKYSGESDGIVGDYQDAINAYKKKDFITAHRIRFPLAEQGNAKAQYDVAKDYDLLGDRLETRKWFRLAAEQGHTDAQLDLAKELGNPFNATQAEIKESVKWHHRAAEGGHADAQHTLGLMYEEGRKVTQDYKEAVKWYRLGAEQGYDFSQDSLGMMYFEGKGVPENYELAYKWLKLSGHSVPVELQEWFDNK